MNTLVRKAKTVLVLALPLILVHSALGADVVLWEEDFEDVVLESSIDEGLVKNKVWSNKYEGWTIETIVPDNIGVREWQSWAFADAAWWTATAGDQERSKFTVEANDGLARGTIAIADPDEWDDKPAAGGNPEAVQDYDTSLTSPPIDIRNAGADSITIQFDSSWRPEDIQEAEVSVSFDGGKPEVLMTMVSKGTTTDFEIEYKRFKENFQDLENVNETIVLDEIPSPAGAREMQITWRMPAADNDWWWAIDNVVVSTNAFSVDATGKLTTTWGSLKRAAR